MSKKEQLIGMLRKPFGAKKETIMANLGWQDHSVRGMISILKKEGFNIIGTKGANGFVYKLVLDKVASIETEAEPAQNEEQAL